MERRRNSVQKNIIYVEQPKNKIKVDFLRGPKKNKHYVIKTNLVIIKNLGKSYTHSDIDYQVSIEVFRSGIDQIIDQA